MVAIDCIGPLPPTTKQNRHIFVAVDTFSRYVEAKAEEEVTSIKFAKFLIANIVSRYGIPSKILTDNAQTFGAEVVKEVCRLFEIKHLKSTPLHSQGNAIVERVNATIGDKLSMVLNGHDDFSRDNWDDALPMILYSINTTVHTSTGISPFELMYGRAPLLFTNATKVKNMTVHQLYSRLTKLQLENNIAAAINSNAMAAATSKTRYDKKRTNISFDVGQKVWVLKNLARNAKLNNRSDGPYTIAAVRDNNIYELEHDQSSKKIIRHVSLLRKVVERNDLDKTISNHSDTNSNSDNESINISDPNKSPQGTMSASSSTSSINAVNVIALMTVTLCCIGTVSTDIPWHQESPVIWHRLDTKVVKGVKQWDLTIGMKSPCIELTKTGEPTVNTDLFNLCQKFYDKEIDYRLDNWCESKFNESERIRRQVGVLEFGAGVVAEYVASSIIESVRGVFKSDKEQHIDEQIARLDEEVTKLQKHANQAYLISRTQDELYRVLARQVDINTKEIHHLAAAFPYHVWTTLYVQNEIRDAALLLERAISSWKSGMVSNDLGKFLKVEELSEIDAASSTTHYCKRVTKGVIKLRFTTRIIDKRSALLEAEAFRVYSNLSETPCLQEFTGHTHVLLNMTANCTRPLTSKPAGAYTFLTCEQQNYAPNLVNQWKNIVCHSNINHIDERDEVVIGKGKVFIYCIRGFIEIEGQRFKCPPFVFGLPVSTAWKTKNHDWTTVKLIANNQRPTFNGNMSVILNSDPHKDSSTEMMDKIAELVKMTEGLNPSEMKSVNSPITVNYRSNTFVTVLATLGAAVAAIGIVWLYYKMRGTKKETAELGRINQAVSPNVFDLPLNTVSVCSEPASLA